MTAKRVAMIICLLVAILSGPFLKAGEETGPAPLDERSRKIVKDAVKALEVGGALEVDAAVEKLVEIGPAAIPLLEEELRIRRKSLLPFIAAIERIRGSRRPESSTSRKTSPRRR